MAWSGEELAVADVARLYVEGMVLADEALLRDQFFPQASIIGNFGGELEWSTVDAFVAAVMAEGAAGHEQPFLDMQAISVTGDAAAIRLADDFAGLRFTDYLSLLKRDGRWRIVAKLYHHHA